MSAFVEGDSRGEMTFFVVVKILIFLHVEEAEHSLQLLSLNLQSPPGPQMQPTPLMWHKWLTAIQ